MGSGVIRRKTVQSPVTAAARMIVRRRGQRAERPGRLIDEPCLGGCGWPRTWAGISARISSGAGLIAQNDELNDFVVVGREIEGEHKRVWKPTLVEQSVRMGCHY